MCGVRLYHANSNKNNHVLLASLQNEEPKAAEGLLEWIWKQVKVPKGTYIFLFLFYTNSFSVIVMSSVNENLRNLIAACDIHLFT